MSMSSRRAAASKRLPDTIHGAGSPKAVCNRSVSRMDEAPVGSFQSHARWRAMSKPRLRQMPPYHIQPSGKAGLGRQALPRTQLLRAGHPFETARSHLIKPVIAAVNGVAMGGGFEAAVACDIIIAAENAVFALPEPRVGLIAGAGGVHRLPRSIPIKKAMGMILTGRRVPAREGFELGFVTEVVPEGQALPAAERWAAMILECSPMAVRASKQASYRGMDEPTLEQAMRTVYPAQRENMESQDYIEGPKAFAEKRKPNWQNR